MRRRLWRILFFTCVVQIFFVGVVSQSQARNLTDVLIEGFSYNAFELDTSLPAKEVAPAFSAAVAQAVTQEFPLASVSPAFVYRLDPAVDIYKRLSSIPGPLFAERALTLGKGQINFGVGYSFIDFGDLNGTSLDNLRSPALVGELFDTEEQPVEQAPAGVDLRPGERLFSAPFSFSQIRARIDLKVHVVVPTLRYGLTDNWDISLSVPIVKTSLRVSNNTVQVVDLDPNSARFLFVRETQGNISRVLETYDFSGKLLALSQWPLIRTSQPSRLPPLNNARGSATGVGDITLRTKYQFWQSGLGGGALGLNLQLPSGEKENFHGTGQTHLFPFLYFSRIIGERFEPHLNVGIDVNTHDIDRSSFLYAVGMAVGVERNLGVMATLLGRSEFTRLSVRIPKAGIYDTGVVLEREPNSCTTQQPCGIKLNNVSFPFFPKRIKRNDMVNFSFGLRYALGTAGSLFFGGIVPLNEDGFRTGFIPSGGIEYTF
jgi:hypothetical protein